MSYSFALVFLPGLTPILRFRQATSSFKQAANTGSCGTRAAGAHVSNVLHLKIQTPVLVMPI